MPPTVRYSGEPVKIPGNYRVIHYRHREGDTETTLRAGEIFPRCSRCEEFVAYILVSHGEAEQRDTGD
jgi:hypothetical protein